MIFQPIHIKPIDIQLYKNGDKNFKTLLFIPGSNAAGRIKIKEVIIFRSILYVIPVDNKRYIKTYRFSSPEGFSYKQSPASLHKPKVA